MYYSLSPLWLLLTPKKGEDQSFLLFLIKLEKKKLFLTLKKQKSLFSEVATWSISYIFASSLMLRLWTSFFVQSMKHLEWLCWEIKKKIIKQMCLLFVLVLTPSLLLTVQSASSTAPMGIVCVWVHWSATSWITAGTTAMRRTAPSSPSTLRRASSTVSTVRCYPTSVPFLFLPHTHHHKTTLPDTHLYLHDVDIFLGLVLRNHLSMIHDKPSRTRRSKMDIKHRKISKIIQKSSSTDTNLLL